MLLSLDLVLHWITIKILWNVFSNYNYFNTDHSMSHKNMRLLVLGDGMYAYHRRKCREEFLNPYNIFWSKLKCIENPQESNSSSWNVLILKISFYLTCRYICWHGNNNWIASFWSRTLSLRCFGSINYQPHRDWLASQNKFDQP